MNQGKSGMKQRYEAYLESDDLVIEKEDVTYYKIIGKESLMVGDKLMC